MADPSKYVARIPVVPDDFENHNDHKDHELVMDFEHEDIYVKNGEGYTNITGKIKEDIKQISDGSAVIHIVTEQSLPPIKDRSENHWYWTITSAQDAGGGSVATSSYIYYGLISSYSRDRNYLLISQNVMSESDIIPFTILEGYSPCLYIPINFGASFKNYATGETIPYTIEDRVYAMNPAAGSYSAYDVYCLELYEPGNYQVQVVLTGGDMFLIQMDTNERTIYELVLPDSMEVRDGDSIGVIPDPTWNDPRYLFRGWSTSVLAPVIIDPTTYKPESPMTLYAWFDYESDPSLLTYYSNYNSTGT